MKTIGLAIGGSLVTAMVASALVTQVPGAQDGFTLARIIPNDVFMYVAEKSNPEREFIGRYWGEFFEALSQSGIGEDLLGLLGAPVGDERIAEVERVQRRQVAKVCESRITDASAMEIQYSK